MKRFVLVVLVLALIALHNDFWNWGQTDPVLFGFLPIGLAYHAGYSIACAVVMWILVKFAWPKHLEDLESIEGPKQEGH